MWLLLMSIQILRVNHTKTARSWVDGKDFYFEYFLVQSKVVARNMHTWNTTSIAIQNTWSDNGVRFALGFDNGVRFALEGDSGGDSEGMIGVTIATRFGFGYMLDVPQFVML